MYALKWFDAQLDQKILDGLHKGPPFWCFCAHIMYEVDT